MSERWRETPKPTEIRSSDVDEFNRISATPPASAVREAGEVERLRAQVEALSAELRRNVVFPTLPGTNGGYCTYCGKQWTKNESERHSDTCLLYIPAIPPEPPGGE